MPITLTIHAETAEEFSRNLATVTASLLAAAATPAPSFTAPVHPQVEDKPKATRAPRKQPAAEAAPETAPETASDERALETAPGNEEQAEQVETADAAADTSEPSAPAAEGDEAVTYDHIRDVLLQLSKKRGRDAIVSLLDAFGIGNAQNLTEEQRAPFLAAAKAKLEG